MQIKMNDDCNGVTSSCLSNAVDGGVSYALQVDGYNGASGSVTILLTFTASAALSPSLSPTATPPAIGVVAVAGDMYTRYSLCGIPASAVVIVTAVRLSSTWLMGDCSCRPGAALVWFTLTCGC